MDRTYILIALIVGLVLGYLVGTNRVNERFGNFQGGMMGGGNMMSNSSMDGMMSGMMGNLGGLEGDAFDKAFLSMMIVHHEGAVRMAESALDNAKHEEIKNLSKNIIESQTREINDMKDWLKSWYGR